jgi:hypothetical protein
MDDNKQDSEDKKDWAEQFSDVMWSLFCLFCAVLFILWFCNLPPFAPK